MVQLKIAKTLKTGKKNPIFLETFYYTCMFYKNIFLTNFNVYFLHERKCVQKSLSSNENSDISNLLKIIIIIYK